MDTMNQQEPSTPKRRVGTTAASDIQPCRISWFTSSQRPNFISPRKRVSATIDEDDEPPATNAKRFAGSDAASSVVTPRELSPQGTSNVMVFDLPLCKPLKGGNSCSPAKDIKMAAPAAASSAATKAFSVMDDEPVWGDSMMDESSAFASSLPQPALNTRKVTAADDGCDEDMKQEDFSSNMFGWFTDDVKEDLKLPKSMTDASLISGESSVEDLTNVGEVKQPFLLPAVSLESSPEDEDSEDSSSVINNRKLSNAEEGDIDANMNLDEPVFEDVILDPSTLNPSAASLDEIKMFDFEEPNEPETSSFLDEDPAGFSSAPHMTTLDPLPYLKAEGETEKKKGSAKQDTNEVMAMDLLADVAGAASAYSIELTDDPLATAYNADASSDDAHQQNERKGKDLSSLKKKGKDKTNKGVCAWREKFDQLRGECLI